MYIMEVKKPSESKGPWDYYKLLKTMSGEEAFGKLAELGMPAGQEVALRRQRPSRLSAARPCRLVLRRGQSNATR